MNQITKIIEEREGVEKILQEEIADRVFYQDRSCEEALRRGLQSAQTRLEFHNKSTILAVLEALEEEVGKLRHEFGQQEGLDGLELGAWKEGHTKCLEEVLSLITLTKQEIA